MMWLITSWIMFSRESWAVNLSDKGRRREFDSRKLPLPGFVRFGGENFNLENCCQSIENGICEEGGGGGGKRITFNDVEEPILNE